MPILFAWPGVHSINSHVCTKVSDIIDHNHTISIILVSWVLLLQERHRIAIRTEYRADAASSKPRDIYYLRSRDRGLSKGLQRYVVDIDVAGVFDTKTIPLVDMSKSCVDLIDPGIGDSRTVPLRALTNLVGEIMYSKSDGLLFLMAFFRKLLYHMALAISPSGVGEGGCGEGEALNCSGLCSAPFEVVRQATAMAMSSYSFRSS